MNYLRRLLTKSRATAPRLAARRLPLFAAAETLIEEADESVFVSPSPAVRILRQNDPVPASDMRSGPDARVMELKSPRTNTSSGDRVPVAERKEPEGTKPADALPDARRPRSYKRLIGERWHYNTRGETDLRSGQQDVEQLIVVAEKPAGQGRRGVAPRVVQPLAREFQPAVKRTTDEATSSTVVNVVIGRIDVRAAAASPTKDLRVEPFRPRMSLDAYLGRDGGST